MGKMRCRAKHFIGVVQACRRNSDGVAAIEFAFIAPILMTMFFGVFEMGRAYAAHRRFLSATNMIGDLVAREKSLSQEGLRSVYQLAPTVMGSYGSSTATLTVEVLPIRMPDPIAKPNDVRIYATPERFDKSTPSCGAQTVTQDVKDLLANTTEGLIMVTSTYAYKPLFAYPLVGSMTWTNVATFAPRQNCVAFGTGTSAKSCTNPC
ncbi:MAG: pilus assembly protein [Hyphomicrobiaceae bacterium]|nr:pilus assembly protein [Hyphomicrobiaceae bacterium]